MVFDAGHIIIYCDNWSVIYLVSNPTFHVIAKHIDAQFYFDGDMVEDRMMKMQKDDTLVTTVDALMKLART